MVAVSVLPPIEEEFVSAGQVKVQVRPVAILGEESELAAQAAECANDQGQFFEFHDTLFLNQGKERSGAFSLQNLKRLAQALALDAASFDSCLDSGKYASLVRAGGQGISKVPTIIINGREVDSTVEAMRSAIKEELASGS